VKLYIGIFLRKSFGVLYFHVVCYTQFDWWSTYILPYLLINCKSRVQPITRPCHRFLPNLTGSRRANCMADPKVCSNRSTHRFDRSDRPIRAKFQNYDYKYGICSLLKTYMKRMMNKGGGIGR